MKPFLLTLLSVYQRWVSPMLGENCRFYPSCSRYAQEAIGKKGALAGLAVFALRILKCHPFHPGGYDPVES